MNTSRQQLNDDVMRRVRFIHAMRQILNPEIMKGLALVASIAVVTLTIHVAQICENMSHLPSFYSYAQYLFDSYMKTDLAVQAFMTLALVAGLWLAGDALMSKRLMGRFHFMRQA